ncbi:DNA internalization-related competence protein ComEC/Rec2 [Halalkalibacter nanhaiisediminis]|uniref:Competence protein ComEC n=1 Tax=Halalkalibacter nanhaiisediminis TaxID=688079 RepID=A0A562QI20_9BACI|nr:DNA internalization-related competence protein ComEC/Rec2 [Halalkalibacter nanhaiisediminis]TWI56381.1 competence protein ComEC [Halalkalibacter nanhaiisediminis]
MQRFLPLIPAAASLGLILAIRGPSFSYAVAFLLFILFCFFHRTFFRKIFLVISIIFLLYYFVGTHALHQQVTVYEAGEQTIIGTIQTIPVIDGDSMSMRLKGQTSEILHVQAFLTFEDEQKMLKQLSPGDRCQIIGTLQEPSLRTNFAQFDYKRYLQEQQIYWILRTESTGIACVQSETGVYYQLQRFRQTQIAHLEKTIDPELAGIMIALLFGERMMMEGDVLEAYQRLGVIHLLAVSGLHVGMIVAAIFYLLIRIGITRERTMEVLILFLPIYIIIAGAAPPVIRASIMAMVVLICLRIRMRVPPLAGVIFVYMFYLLINPFVLFQLGFQLSFLISFALILSASLIGQRYHHPAAQLLAVTMLSQMLSTPLLLMHVYEFSWISIPLNLIYIPFVTLCVLPLSAISFLLSSFVPSSLNIPLLFLEIVVPYAHKWLTDLAQFKWSSFIVGKPPAFLVLCMYVAITYGCLCWENGRKNWWIKPILIFSVLILGQMGAPYLDSRAKVTMIDVGQGDSYLLELPYRKGVYLIDTGGTISFFDEEWRKRRRPFDVGASIVVPELKSRGISRIDRLILSHGHIDHIGGAYKLSKAIQIEEVLYGKGPVEGEREREILEELINQGAQLTFIEEGVQWSLGSSHFVVLSPLGSEVDLNARSIVLYAELGGISFLFTGDLEEEGERRIISTYPNLQVDVLKVGHHGSHTSTSEDFLQQLDPKAAFISVGRNNRFSHPHLEVVERLHERGIIIWRSDEGAVRLLLKDGQVEVETVDN